MSAATQQGMPKLSSPLTNEDRTVSIPWYFFLMRLWISIGGASSSIIEAVYLVVSGGVLKAYQPSPDGKGSGTLIGTIPLAGPGLPPQELSPTNPGPFLYVAPAKGNLIVTRGQLELRRQTATFYLVSVQGGALKMLEGDIARVSWFTTDLPSITWFQD